MTAVATRRMAGRFALAKGHHLIALSSESERGDAGPSVTTIAKRLPRRASATAPPVRFTGLDSHSHRPIPRSSDFAHRPYSTNETARKLTLIAASNPVPFGTVTATRTANIVLPTASTIPGLLAAVEARTRQAGEGRSQPGRPRRRQLAAQKPIETASLGQTPLSRLATARHH